MRPYKQISELVLLHYQRPTRRQASLPSSVEIQCLAHKPCNCTAYMYGHPYSVSMHRPNSNLDLPYTSMILRNNSLGVSLVEELREAYMDRVCPNLDVPCTIKAAKVAGLEVSAEQTDAVDTNMVMSSLAESAFQNSSYHVFFQNSILSFLPPISAIPQA